MIIPLSVILTKLGWSPNNYCNIVTPAYIIPAYEIHTSTEKFILYDYSNNHNDFDGIIIKKVFPILDDLFKGRLLSENHEKELKVVMKQVGIIQ